MNRSRKYDPKQDPCYRRGGADGLNIFLTRQAGTNTWDCTAYLVNYQEVVELWTRQPDGTLSSRFYGLKDKMRMLKWVRVTLPTGVGGTELLRQAARVVREMLGTPDRTERPSEMDELFP